MNYKEAKSVKHLAPGVIKVLEGLEWECPECKGRGQKLETLSGVGIYPTSCSCNGKGKTSYTWTPQVGGWYLSPSKKVLLMDRYSFDTILLSNKGLDNITPILEWEEIEKVLEKAGYWLEVEKPLDKYLEKNTMMVGCAIFQEQDADCIIFKRSKSRTRAVYDAVLALGKEMK